VITVPAGVRILVASKPVDFRRGADSLAAVVREQLRQDPFSGTLFIFRSKRAHPPTFCIPFSCCDHCLSLAPVVRTDVAGLALPARQGFDVHLHG
jgi:transposase